MRKVEVADGQAEGMEAPAPEMAAPLGRPSEAMTHVDLLPAKPAEALEETVVEEAIEDNGHAAEAAARSAGFASLSRQYQNPLYKVTCETVLGKLRKLMPDGVPSRLGAGGLEGHHEDETCVVEEFKTLVEEAVAKYSSTLRDDLLGAAGVHG